MTGPEKYLDVTVPDHIRSVWQTWEAVEWRLCQHYNNSNFYPPDQRFGVDRPDGMCAVHRSQWRRWQGRRFKGQLWPGPVPGCRLRTADGWKQYRSGGIDYWERARVEWDTKTIAQMKAIEELCLSGRSAQCAGDRRRRSVVSL
ncbi:hypothetical protein [Nocardia sp. NPDC049149]|uniref:hypothetical protein n=1 Tax=Nocardia sp. NPDC049149 TaxID=3364315 RepID=UPI00371B50F2